MKIAQMMSMLRQINRYKSCGLVLHRTFPLRRSTTSCVTVSKEKIKWDGLIGIEVHAQINSKSKLFSGSGTEFAELINNQVSFFDASFPGTLPVLNRRCVEAAVITGLALNCHINLVSKFDRKHYFYADLPAGYQITQQRQPIAVDGNVEYNLITQPGQAPAKKHVKIRQIQIEQDSGKSVHDEDERISLIDLNRAGVGLMEIVTEPVFRYGEEVAAFIKELQLVLKAIGTCNGKMEEGSLRVDANVSVNKPGDPMGIRTEVKNLNSIRSVYRAINYEIRRQITELEAGREIINETRSFSVDDGITVVMRDKERLQDYRFMPEPNLPPLRLYTNNTITEELVEIGAINIDKFKENMPMLPEEKRLHLMEKYSITRHQVVVLMNEDGLLEYFEEILEDGNHIANIVANWLTIHLITELNKLEWLFTENPISARSFCEFASLIEQQSITTLTGKMVLRELLVKPHESPRGIVEAKNWWKISDCNELLEFVEKIINDNPKAVNDYKKGKKKALKYLIGQVVTQTEGRADPQLVIDVLETKMAV